MKARVVARVLWLAFRMLNAGALAWLAAACALVCAITGLGALVLGAGAWGAWPEANPRGSNPHDAPEAEPARPGLAGSPPSDPATRDVPRQGASSTPAAVTAARQIKILREIGASPDVIATAEKAAVRFTNLQTGRVLDGSPRWN